jgi:hypothetical protein
MYIHVRNYRIHELGVAPCVVVRFGSAENGHGQALRDHVFYRRYKFGPHPVSRIEADGEEGTTTKLNAARTHRQDRRNSCHVHAYLK